MQSRGSGNGGAVSRVLGEVLFAEHDPDVGCKGRETEHQGYSQRDKDQGLSAFIAKLSHWRLSITGMDFRTLPKGPKFCYQETGDKYPTRGDANQDIFRHY